MIALLLNNLLAYSGQLAILIVVGTALAAVLKLTPKARLYSLQLLLFCCLVLPFAQPWRPQEPERMAVTAVTVPLSYESRTSIAPGHWTPTPDQIILGILAAGVIIRLALIGFGMLRLGRYLENARFMPTAFPVEKQRTRA